MKLDELSLQRCLLICGRASRCISLFQLEISRLVCSGLTSRSQWWTFRVRRDVNQHGRQRVSQSLCPVQRLCMPTASCHGCVEPDELTGPKIGHALPIIPTGCIRGASGQWHWQSIPRGAEGAIIDDNPDKANGLQVSTTVCPTSPKDSGRACPCQTDLSHLSKEYVPGFHIHVLSQGRACQRPGLNRCRSFYLHRGCR
jgi:hypothetical protein